MLTYATQLALLARTFAWSPLFVVDLHTALYMMLALDASNVMALLATLYWVRRPFGPKPMQSPPKEPLSRPDTRHWSDESESAVSALSAKQASLTRSHSFGTAAKVSASASLAASAYSEGAQN